MPVYCFRSEKTGEVIEEFYRMADVPKSVHKNGDVYARDFRSEMANVPSEKGWPIECVASGVHPDQANDLRRHFHEHGVNVKVSSDGNPIYENPRQRRKALACRGLVDKSSYY